MKTIRDRQRRVSPDWGPIRMYNCSHDAFYASAEASAFISNILMFRSLLLLCQRKWFLFQFSILVVVAIVLAAVVVLLLSTFAMTLR